jgi:hypothetical protein
MEQVAGPWAGAIDAAKPLSHHRQRSVLLVQRKSLEKAIYNAAPRWLWRELVAKLNADDWPVETVRKAAQRLKSGYAEFTS